MVNQESIFVPIDFNSYKDNKIRALKIRLVLKKIDLLIKTIEETKKIKAQYQKELTKALLETNKELEKFKKRLPLTSKIHQKRENLTFNDSFVDSNVDSELKNIQEELKKLS